MAARFAADGKRRIGYAINLGKTPQEFQVVSAAGRPVPVRDRFGSEGKESPVMASVRLGSCEILNFEIVA